MDSLTANPLPEVILLQNGTWLARSDSNGVARFRTWNDTIQAVRVGYQTKTFCLSKNNQTRLFFVPELLQQDGLTVRENAQFHLPQVAIKTISRNELQQNADMLQELNNAFNIDIVEHNGRKTLRLHGATSKQLVVYVNGVKVNDPITGEATLENVNLSEIDYVQLAQGAGAAGGDGGLAGALFLSSTTSTTKPITWEAELGSYGKHSQRFHTGFSWLQIQHSLSVQWEQSENDFTYQHATTKETMHRINNDERKLSAQYHGRKQGRHQVFDLHLEAHKNRKGAPGPTNLVPHFNQAQIDIEEARGSVHYEWENQLATQIAFASAYRFYEKEYENKNANNTFPASSRNRYQWWENRAEFTQDWQDFQFSVQPLVWVEDIRNLNRLENVNPKTRFSRTNISASFGVTHQKEWSNIGEFQTAYWWKRHFSNIHHYQNSQTVSAGWKINHLAIHPYSEFVYSENYRFPQLSSLFWQGDAHATGNPNLKPERSYQMIARFGFDWENSWLKTQHNVEWQQTYYYDLIYWFQNFQGTWKPMNLGASVSRGWIWQEKIEWNSWLAFDGQYALIKSRQQADATCYKGKSLLYAPDRKASAQLTWKPIQQGNIFAEMEYVDQRYITLDNLVDPLESFTLYHAGIRWQWEHPRFQATFSFRMNNLTDESIFYYKDVPQPGRTFLISTKITFQNS